MQTEEEFQQELEALEERRRLLKYKQLMRIAKAPRLSTRAKRLVLRSAAAALGETAEEAIIERAGNR